MVSVRRSGGMRYEVRVHEAAKCTWLKGRGRGSEKELKREQRKRERRLEKLQEYVCFGSCISVVLNSRALMNMCDESKIIQYLRPAVFSDKPSVQSLTVVSPATNSINHTEWTIFIFEVLIRKLMAFSRTEILCSWAIGIRVGNLALMIHQRSLCSCHAMRFSSSDTLFLSEVNKRTRCLILSDTQWPLSPWCCSCLPP